MAPAAAADATAGAAARARAPSPAGWRPVARISLGLVVVTCCILLVTDLLGLTPGRSDAALEARRQLCETLAVHVARDAQRGDWAAIQTTMDLLRRRSGEIRSVAVRSAEGALLARSGDHARAWQPPPDGRSTPTHAQVPILRGSERWGALEVAFEPLPRRGLLGLGDGPLGPLLLAVASAGFAAYALFMRRTLRHLDPSAVIPPRVQAVLDTLAEGVVLMDADGRVVLANAALCRTLGADPDALLGVQAAKLPWLDRVGRAASPADLPWVRTLRSGGRETAHVLGLANAAGERHTFSVNAAPIVDDGGRLRGALATFDDVTQLQATTEELRRALDELLKSREEVRLQNEELKVLATLDPLTGCLNRRSFLERLEAEFADARERGAPLHCAMVDVDHFKRVNDGFGHSTGDHAIQVVAGILGTLLRAGDEVCRFGGEEFCVLLRGRDDDEAQALCEVTRRRLETLDPTTAGLPRALRITASFGLASIHEGAPDAGALVDQADQALYASKGAGRNRVTVYRREV